MRTTQALGQMKTFVRNHFEDFVNNRNAAVIQTNMTPDFYDHDGLGGKPTDVDGDEKMILAIYKSMPDLHLPIEDMIAEGDKIMCRNIWRWTDTASGKKHRLRPHHCNLSSVRVARDPGAAVIDSPRPSYDR